MHGRLHLITILWLPLTALTWMLFSHWWPSVLVFALGLYAIIATFRKNSKD